MAFIYSCVFSLLAASSETPRQVYYMLYVFHQARIKISLWLCTASHTATHGLTHGVAHGKARCGALSRAVNIEHVDPLCNLQLL